MIALLLLYLSLSTSQADYASYHVQNFLNYSVSPCENFYRHVCSIGMPAHKSVQKKSEKFWTDLAEKLNAGSLNNPVLNDIREARQTLGCTIDGSVYSNWLENRCYSDFDCYFGEFLYFFNLFEKSTENVDDSLKFYATYGATGNRNISQAVKATARMVELLCQNTDSFEEAVGVFIRLQDRLYVVEQVTQKHLLEFQGIQQLTNQLKEVMMRKFEETAWMKVTNEFGFNILDQFATILDEIIVQTEFDNFDQDMTTLKKINRDMNSKYYEHSKRETGCKWFDVWHAFATAIDQLNEMDTTSDEDEVYFRLEQSLAYNAVNFGDSNIIILFAPTFYPLLHNATGTTTLAFAGDILGHELYHSFVTEALLNRSYEFRTEAMCLRNHYNRSCQLFAEGECKSGAQTFLEDAADLEGVRAAYELLRAKFNASQLKGFAYPKLKITREQSFFYSIAMRSCSDAEHSAEDEHSSFDVRVNARVSQMPEFSAAFGCKPNDVLYAHRQQLCVLFGRESGKVRSGAKQKMIIPTTTTANTQEDSSKDGDRLLLDEF